MVSHKVVVNATLCLFQNGSSSEQAHPSSYLVASSPAKEKQQEKYKKLSRKDNHVGQWKSKYHLLIEELKPP
jgi:hypothetical protein